MHLTPRETAILAHLQDGKTNRQIAAALQCSTTAIIDAIATLYRTFGAHDRESLIAFAQREKIARSSAESYQRQSA